MTRTCFTSTILVYFLRFAMVFDPPSHFAQRLCASRTPPYSSLLSLSSVTPKYWYGLVLLV